MPIALPFHRSLTLFQLVVLGFAVITLPLIVVLITSLMSLDRLGTQSRQAVLGAVNAIQTSRTLVEDATAMERHARQYQILGDPALFEVYTARRESFVTALDAIKALELATSSAGQVHLMGELERHLFRVLNEAEPRSAAMRLAMDDFPELNNLAREVFQDSVRAVAQEVETMQDETARVRHRLLWQAATVIPAVLLLAAIFAILIARPLGLLKQAIHTLGTGSFDHPIHVSGSHDLSDLGQRLDWLRERLVELEQQKTTFLQHISHELKTPLANIREGSELLGDEVMGELNPQQREITTIVQLNSVQLQRLIEDLIHFSAAQSALPTIASRPVRLDTLIRDVIKQHTLTARANAIRIELESNSLSLDTDADKLHVIMDNLLSNAIKFSPPSGQIRIRGGQLQEQIFVEVTDQGPGIPPHEREKVFEAFYQGSARSQSPVRGSGLGLAIAREYTRALGGQLHILDSSNGTRIRLLLPRSGAAPLPSKPLAQAPEALSS